MIAHLATTGLFGLCIAAAPAGSLAVEPTAAQLAELDGLARQHHQPEGSRRSIEAARALYRQHPDSFAAAWRLARAAFLHSYGQSDDAQRARLGWEGYEAGLRAIALQPARVEGHYWGGCALGEYGQSAGIVKAVVNGVGGKILALFERAAALDPDYNEGGPLEALGRYHYMVPWPMRDLAASRRYLERAAQGAPHKIRAHAYLADTYRALELLDRARQHYALCAQAPLRPEIEIDGAQFRQGCLRATAELGAAR